jgi:hypothetical protein
MRRDRLRDKFKSVFTRRRSHTRKVVVEEKEEEPSRSSAVGNSSGALRRTASTPASPAAIYQGLTGLSVENEPAFVHAAITRALQRTTLLQRALGDSHADINAYEELAKLVVRRTYKKSEVIILQGTPANEIFIVESGTRGLQCYSAEIPASYAGRQPTARWSGRHEQQASARLL